MNEPERLRAENQRLADEIKRLVGTERHLYAIQEQLDRRVRIYRKLYEIGRKFNATLDLSHVLELTIEFVLYELNFERCLVLLRREDRMVFCVQAMDGYYDRPLSSSIAELTLSLEGSMLSEWLSSSEHVLCPAACDDQRLLELRKLFGMDEYVVFRLGGDAKYPIGLVVAGNTAGRAPYQSRVEADSEAMLGLANLVSQTSTAINNANFYQALEGERQLLEEKVKERTRELSEAKEATEEANRELDELNKTLEQRVERQVTQLERLGRLKRFFSPQLAELIVDGAAEDPLKSHRREVAVVFLDLRGFTAFAETAEPEEVMGVLREYHAEMGKLILEHEGTLERFTGDGMMIFFNDPVPVPNPAERASRMAIVMRDRVKELSVAWRKRGYDLALGVGIAQGYATIGAIGFEGRWDYGAIGTVTNLAARLCGEASGGQILVSAPVGNALEDLIQAEEVGPLVLKGLLKPVLTFNVLGLKANG